LTGAKVTAPIKKGDLITSANAAVPANSKIAALRARQDAMLGL
jgi:predicted homoserine dehydrogenase-like protein